MYIRTLPWCLGKKSQCSPTDDAAPKSPLMIGSTLEQDCTQAYCKDMHTYSMHTHTNMHIFTHTRSDYLRLVPLYSPFVGIPWWNKECIYRQFRSSMIRPSPHHSAGSPISWMKMVLFDVAASPCGQTHLHRMSMPAPVKTAWANNAND